MYNGCPGPGQASRVVPVLKYRIGHFVDGLVRQAVVQQGDASKGTGPACFAASGEHKVDAPFEEAAVL